MRLSRKNAENIVKELNTVIDQSVNMMNEHGIIIASTDQERVGQIHEGARKIIEQNLEELVIRPEDVYEGSLEGVNYPITIGGEVIGVVGITGPVQEVAKYGQITRKMTEILMQELSIKEQKDMDENLRNRFLSEWLLSDTVMINKNFVDRGKRMHIDITLPRRIMVIAVQVSDCHSDSLDEMRIVESAENRIKNLLKRLDRDSVYLKSSSCLICGVANRADPGAGTSGGKSQRSRRKAARRQSCHWHRRPLQAVYHDAYFLYKSIQGIAGMYAFPWK